MIRMSKIRMFWLNSNVYNRAIISAFTDENNLNNKHFVLTGWQLDEEQLKNLSTFTLETRVIRSSWLFKRSLVWMTFLMCQQVDRKTRTLRSCDNLDKIVDFHLKNSRTLLFIIVLRGVLADTGINLADNVSSYIENDFHHSASHLDVFFVIDVKMN